MKKTMMIFLILLTFYSIGSGYVDAEEEYVLEYFFSPYCGTCHQVKELLNQLERDYPGLKVESYSILNNENHLKFESYCQSFDVPEEKVGIVPAVFIGDTAIIGKLILERLPEVMANKEHTGDLNLKNISKGEVHAKIIQRFESFNWGIILVAGLIDGINPCAISTLLFFISYLLISGKKDRSVIYLGVSFILGIFLSYLSLGWGLFQIGNYLEKTTQYAKWIYPLMSIVVTIFAVVSIWDYVMAKTRRANKAKMQLPKGVVKLINRTVVKFIDTKNLVIMSFLIGVILSLLEFMCTGQVYLPTIVYMMGIDNVNNSAAGYLLLYNFAFILPMLAIVIVAYKTKTSRTVKEYMNERISGVKFVMMLLFVSLSIAMWMLTFRVL